MSSATNVHSRNRLGQGERRDEQAGVEGGIAPVADVEVEDELPGVWEDGSECDRLCDADESWWRQALVGVSQTHRRDGGRTPTKEEELCGGKLVGVAGWESLVCK